MSSLQIAVILLGIILVLDVWSIISGWRKRQLKFRFKQAINNLSISPINC